MTTYTPAEKRSHIQSLRTLLAVAMLVLCGFMSYGAPASESSLRPILIISSYNPQSDQTADNINNFTEEYKAIGGIYPIRIENMNCKSFSEAHEWSQTMRKILMKYQADQTPILIIIFGQEAWASYMAQSESLANRNIPLLCGMVSRNAIALPGPHDNPREWMPTSIDVLDDLDSENIISGFLNEFNVDKNIKLIRKLYPNINKIAFVSDNTYGGVSLQAYVRKCMENYPNMSFISLDARQYSFDTLVKQAENLPENTALLLGTWRVGMDESYLVSSMLDDVINANHKVPCFTMTSAGLQHGAIGGYMPRYPKVGKDLASLAYEYVDSPEKTYLRPIQYIPNEYRFDYNQLRSKRINISELPTPYEMENEIPFFEKYRSQLLSIGGAFAILLLGYLVVFYYYFRIKKFRDALQESEKNNILILNNIEADIKFITPSFRIKWFNNTTVGTEAGVKPKNIYPGALCHKVEHDFDEPCLFCPVADAIAARSGTEITVENDGRYLTILATPVYDPATGTHIGTVVRSQDVTEIKERESELRAAKEKAEESDQLKSAFLANMSHEIRTPLNAIVGFSSVLISEGIGDEERKEYAGIVQTNSDLLLRLINDILNISRLETGRISFNLASYDISTLCQSIITTAQRNRKKEIEYILDIPPGNLEITTDAQRLQQVVTNLISNAEKFTDSGTITLSAYLDKTREMMVFSITDTGKGIPPEKRKLIFERFEKLDEYMQGTGLGLAICKITVNLLGGDIWVDEFYNGGARFVFTHPIVPPEIDAKEPHRGTELAATALEEADV